MSIGVILLLAVTFDINAFDVRKSVGSESPPPCLKAPYDCAY